MARFTTFVAVAIIVACFFCLVTRGRAARLAVPTPSGFSLTPAVALPPFSACALGLLLSVWLLFSVWVLSRLLSVLSPVSMPSQ